MALLRLIPRGMAPLPLGEGYTCDSVVTEHRLLPPCGLDFDRANTPLRQLKHNGTAMARPTGEDKLQHLGIRQPVLLELAQQAKQGRRTQTHRFCIGIREE
jgi:hypothetical protein